MNQNFIDALNRTENLENYVLDFQLSPSRHVKIISDMATCLLLLEQIKESYGAVYVLSFVKESEIK